MLARLVFFGVLLSILASCSKNEEKVVDMKVLEAKLNVHAQDYMMALKSVLLSNMKSGGPLTAVHVCSDTAQQMRKLYSETMDVVVRRASIKNRNEMNFPNEFETKAINMFHELKRNNSLTKESNLIEQKSIGGKEVVKFAKPILVGAPCLNCHGQDSQISKEVAEVIAEKYPHDKATGYKIGDLRGVISVTKEL